MHAAAASGVHAIVLLGEQYESARAHAAQWGHGDLTTVLGRDRERPNIFEPAGVIEVVVSTRNQERFHAYGAAVRRPIARADRIHHRRARARQGRGRRLHPLACGRSGPARRLVPAARAGRSAHPRTGPRSRSSPASSRCGCHSRCRGPSALRAAKEFLAASPADWVSLQFVPYSFQRWGVAAKLVRALPELVGRSRLHVMFHEVWIDGGTSRAPAARQRRAAARRS